MDHPLTRAHPVCPLCGGMKGKGNLVCWPCYGQNDLRHGNPEAERRLDANETELERGL